VKLKPSACYGFRVYLPGAYLHNHVDSAGTHIVSSAICVDKDVAFPWPLHVVDIDGQEIDVDLEPGEFVLYESARISHGRPTPLKGRFHVGLFLHYRPISG
jgi:prolyl 4-hydroxylase